MKKLHVIIPGLGSPHLEHKLRILRGNLAVLRKGPWSVTASICLYDLLAAIPQDLESDPAIHWKRHAGLVGEHLLHCHPPTGPAHDADWVVVLLDDVELIGPIDWESVLHLSAQTSADILSPSLRNNNSPWRLMRQDVLSPDLFMRLQTACELFCYLMPSKVYARYHALIEPGNQWLWGVDFVLHSVGGLTAGVLNGVAMDHHYLSRDRRAEKHAQMRVYLAKHGRTFREIKRAHVVLRCVFLKDNWLARLQKTGLGRLLSGALFRPGGRPAAPPLVIGPC